MVDRMIRLVMFVLLSLGSAQAVFAEMTDPTRPPEGIGGAYNGGIQSADGQVEAKPAGLQSVIISKTHRAAIIGGQLVELGGQYEGARLVEISEGRVVLLGSKGRQVMTMFPDVKMSGKKEAANKKSNAKSISRSSDALRVDPVEHKEEK